MVNNPQEFDETSLGPLEPESESGSPAGVYPVPASEEESLSPDAIHAATPPTTTVGVFPLPRPAYEEAPAPPRSAYGNYQASPGTPSSPGAPSHAATRDSGVAIILEVLPGLAGFLGIGWLYAGNTTAGILWLAGFLFWNIVAVVLDFVLLGLFLCLHIPINIATIAVSAFLLNDYIKKHRELFGKV